MVWLLDIVKAKKQTSTITDTYVYTKYLITFEIKPHEIRKRKTQKH